MKFEPNYLMSTPRFASHDVLMFRYCDIDTRQNSGIAPVFSLLLFYSLQLLTRCKRGTNTLEQYNVLEATKEKKKYLVSCNPTDGFRGRVIYCDTLLVNGRGPFWRSRGSRHT